MKSVKSGQETERRRKRLAVVVGAAVAATLLTVARGYWRNSRHEVKLLLPRTLPAHAEQQLSGYSFTRSMGGRRIFTVHAAKTVAFDQGGATDLEDVWVELFGAQGTRHDILGTHQCKYNAQTGALAADGKVEIVLNADSVSSAGFHGRPAVFIETSHVSFQPQGSLVVSQEPVEFRAGPATGHARGLRYGIQGGWLELGSDVAVDILTPGRPRPEPPAHLTASRLRYEKSKGEVTLAGPVEVTQGTRHLSAGEGQILLDAGNRVAGATLSRGVEASDKSGGDDSQISAPSIHAEFGVDHRLRVLRAQGGVRGDVRRQGRDTHLTSETLEVDFSGVSPKAQKGNASGSVRIASEPLTPRGSQVWAGGEGATVTTDRDELTADRVDFSFQPGGRFLSEARTGGRGKLVLQPNSPRQGERDVTANPLVMTFDSRGQLTKLDGLSQSQIVFLPPATAAKGAPADETTSDRFEAAFDPQSQSLKSLDELGNFQFREGDWRASADRAHYDPGVGTVELRGRPIIWDSQNRSVADRILLHIEDGMAEGWGRVEATHQGSSGSLFAPTADDPTHVVADRMTAERTGGAVHYRGHVRAWHGENVLESSELDFSKSQRRVTSAARVVTSHLAPGPLAPGLEGKVSGGSQVRPVVIRADRLEYFDDGRKGSYRGNVAMESQGATLTADALDVYFSAAAIEGESQIERAVAGGHVVVVRETRRGTGDHAEYWAKEDKIELTGGPPALYDAGKDFTTGRRLTFYMANDTVLVDGDAATPTYSKHRIPQ